MKTLAIVVLSLGVLLGVVSPISAFAVEPAQAAADHLAMAASYEQQATSQDALIAEHTTMKKEYKDRFFVNEKVTPISKVRKMERHCDAIIKDAQKVKNDLLDFAKWHRMRAAELQGR
ncbi:MAG: hypothetical protein HY447_03995 [Candidatus Omnitrophica bacterium]|nr:hypothetical protein [Candidatus Omnitrophota bacterium]